MNSFPFQYDSGLKLTGGVLGFDRVGPGLSFISSAEVSGAWRVRKTICSEMTARLLSVVRREFRPLVLPFGREFDVGPLRVAIYPAGDFPGSAAIVVESGGKRMIYCAGRPSDPDKLPQCDLIAAAVTSIDAVDPVVAAGSLVKSVRTALSVGLVPVIRCNPIGAAISVCSALSAAGIPVKVHRGVDKFARIWRVNGFDAGSAATYSGGVARGFAIVLPAHSVKNSIGNTISNPWRICVVRAGSSEDCMADADETITLPGALSLSGLQDLVKSVGAGQVVLTGEGAGFCGRSMSASGLKTTVFDPHNQFDLLL
jgi:hypothetical protein